MSLWEHHACVLGKARSTGAKVEAALTAEDEAAIDQALTAIPDWAT